MSRLATRMDSDARLVRRTAIRVGWWIAAAVAVLVLAALVAVFFVVFSQVPLSSLVQSHPHEEPIDLGGRDVLVGGLSLGALAIVLAGTLALLATQRAVAPLVDALARQRRFVADASHELRTPLAVLDSRLQLFERSLAADDPHRAVVGDLRADSRNLIDVVNDLLASVDVSEANAERAIDVDQAVEEAVASMRTLATDRGVNLVVLAAAHGSRVDLTQTSLKRAVVALADNAVKHSPAGATVTVATSTHRRKAVIAVSDQGSGIQGIAKERVFERFARSSDAVDGGGSSSTGFGIGLALVQETAGRCGGVVEVTETSAAGTTITMTLPTVKG